MKRINISLAPLVLTLCLLASCNYGAKPIDPQEPAASSSSTNVTDLCHNAQNKKINVQVRLAAVNALGEFSTQYPEAVGALCKATEDEEWYVRLAAVNALGEFSSQYPEAVGALCKATEDEEWLCPPGSSPDHWGA